MGRPRIDRTDEERRAARAVALARYEASEKGKATRYRANHSPKADARYARYRMTEKYKAAQDRFHHSPKGRASATESSARWRDANPERYAAHMRVSVAVATGALVKPDVCSRCSAQKPLDAHHYLGYVGHELDVVWLCRACHKKTPH